MPNTTDIFADNWGSKEELINKLKTDSSVLSSDRLEQAFRAVDRADFLRPAYQVEAYEDYALPTTEETEILKPTVLAYLLEHLSVSQDDLVLNIGAGSGWSTAILAELTGKNGRVISYEVEEALVERAQENLAAYDFRGVEVRLGNPLTERPKEAPFSRILVTAEAGGVPDALVAQLAIGGTLIMPVDGEVVKIVRKSDKKMDEQTFPGFSFNDLQT